MKSGQHTRAWMIVALSLAAFGLTAPAAAGIFSSESKDIAHLRLSPSDNAPSALSGHTLPELAPDPSLEGFLETALQSGDPYLDKLRIAANAFSNKDCATALRHLKEIIGDERFTRNIDRQGQYNALFMALQCALSTNDYEYAYQTIKRMVPYDPKNTALLNLQHILALAYEDGDTWEATIVLLGEAEPGALNRIEIRDIWRGLRLLGEGEKGDERRLAILDILRAKNYTPSNPLRLTDYLKKTHIRLLIKVNREGEIGSLVDSMTIPMALIGMHVSRAYEPVWDIPSFQTKAADWSAVAEAYVTESIARMAAHPARLEAVVDVMQALRLVGESTQAADVGAAAGQKIGQGIYMDEDDWKNWALNEWAYALYDLGRNDEARAIMIRAAAADEKGSPNVSQVINSAALLLYEGAFDEALGNLDTLPEERVSVFGRAFIHQIRACVHLMQGNAEAAGTHLAFVQENKDTNESAYVEAMICQDNKDLAAERYIARLRDPDKREGALVAMQTYKKHDTVALPVQETLRTRLYEVQTRAEVRAEAEKVGRLTEIPLYETYWGTR